MVTDSKVHGANMGPIWGWQDPGGPHVGSMNLAIWVGKLDIAWFTIDLGIKSIFKIILKFTAIRYSFIVQISHKFAQIITYENWKHLQIKFLPPNEKSILVTCQIHNKNILTVVTGH